MPAPPSNLQNALSSFQNHIPTDIASILVHNLGQLIPGYGFITALIRHKLGVDADRVLAVLGFFFGGWAFIRYVKDTIIPKILSSFTCQLHVSGDDKVYEDLNKWLMGKRVFHMSRTIKLVGNKAYVDHEDIITQPNGLQIHRWGPGYPNAPSKAVHRFGSLARASLGLARNSQREKSNIFDFAQRDKDSGETAEEIFNATAAEALEPLRFEPRSGTRWFFHRYRLFLLSKGDGSLRLPSDPYNSDQVVLRCLGFSTQPLKDLVEEARAERHEERVLYTSVFRYQRSTWCRLATRVTRPFHTIVLSKEMKNLIVRDANDFLQPAGARWYAAHGIPYRRGYLFSGPPGTGKSSVSYALAGLLGLDIYIIPLSDGRIQEHEVENVFSSLPSRCVVLLEDIDCASIRREDDDEEDPQRLDKQARLRRMARQCSSTVTLSGLLNAIDGVAAHEGRILVMTTNKPETLDDALKRPGRVDLHIRFPLASKADVREIFVRMYSIEKKAGYQTPTNSDVKGELTVQEICRDSTEQELYCPYMAMDELQDLANRFANSVPDGTFSPAEVQGQLLMFRHTPRDAVDRARDWISEEIARKQRDAVAKEKKAKADSKEKESATALVARLDRLLSPLSMT